MPSSNRNPNRSSSIYLGSDEYWHGRVTVGERDDGKPDRRHVMSRSKSVVVGKVRALERLRDSGRVARPGQAWTVKAWLEHWLTNIAQPSLRHSSFNAYRFAVDKHLVPALGRLRLNRLEPEQLERLYQGMFESGARPGTAHQVHRTIRTALGEAFRRGYVSHNVAEVAKPPRVQPDPVEPFTVEEMRRILDAALSRRNGTRWAVALSLGLRQGEALGLRWCDVDLEAGTLRVRSTLLRPVYRHGCGGACGRSVGFCPKRVRVNPELGETKSSAGKRVIGLPPRLVGLLAEHRSIQRIERIAARQLWVDRDWVFASVTGESIVPNSDFHAWKALLRAAGVRELRLHDARHSAATMLLVLGVPERTVMGVMGWSSTSMAARYQHVTDPIRRDVAARMGDLLWSPEAKLDVPDEHPEDRN